MPGVTSPSDPFNDSDEWEDEEDEAPIDLERLERDAAMRTAWEAEQEADSEDAE